MEGSKTSPPTKEKCSSDHVGPEFGICFVDTSTAEFNLVHFEDDINRTKLETLILQIKPKELVTEKVQEKKSTVHIFQCLIFRCPGSSQSCYNPYPKEFM